MVRNVKLAAQDKRCIHAGRRRLYLTGLALAVCTSSVFFSVAVQPLSDLAPESSSSHLPYEVANVLATPDYCVFDPVPAPDPRFHHLFLWQDVISDPYDWVKTKVTKYVPAGFNEGANSGEAATDSDTASAFVCVLHEENAQGGDHFGHIVSVLTMCYSLYLHHFSAANVPCFIAKNTAKISSIWAPHLLTTAGCSVVDAWPPPATTSNDSSMIRADESPALLVEPLGYRWGGLNHEKVFFFERAHADQLRLNVIRTLELGEILATADTSQQVVTSIGILNRDDRKRTMLHAKDIETALRCWSLLQDENVSVSLVQFEGATFKEQVEWVLHQDVILSPHGAQLANLVFIRPCTIVVELTNRFYCRPGDFSRLVRDVGGVPFFVYPGEDPNETDPRLTNATPSEAREFRSIVRNNPHTITAEEILDFLPRILAERKTCLDELANRPQQSEA